MLIPSAKKTQRYFSRYGYLVQKSACGECMGWKLCGVDLPLDGKWFPSLGALWLEWMEYAAELIYYDDHYEVFMRQFLRSDADERERLAQIIRRHIRQERCVEIDRMFSSIKPPSTDRLPKNWKRRLRHLWTIDFNLGSGYEIRLLETVERQHI